MNEHQGEEKYPAPKQDIRSLCDGGSVTKQINAKTSLRDIIQSYKITVMHLEEIYRMLPEQPTYDQNNALMALFAKLNQ